MKKILLAFLTAFLLAPVCSSAATIWDESVDGDLGNSLAVGIITDLGTLGVGASDILGDLDAGTTSSTSDGPDEFDVIQFTTDGPWTFDNVALSFGSETSGLSLFLLDGANQTISTLFITSPTMDVFGTLGAGTFKLFHIPNSNKSTAIYTSRINVASTIEPVTIDIKPGSDPNCFNINGHGVIPVAIFGNDNIDVNNINQATLLFGNLAVRVRGNKGPLCSIEYYDSDIFLDLVCHFEDDASNWDPGDGEATLTGTLLDGTTEFEGTDSICVTP